MQITCDTTATDAAGNIHAVISRPVNTRNPDLFDMTIGDTLTLVDQITGVEVTGTLATFETSIDTPTQPGPGQRALRVELVITPG